MLRGLPISAGSKAYSERPPSLQGFSGSPVLIIMSATVFTDFCLYLKAGVLWKSGRIFSDKYYFSEKHVLATGSTECSRIRPLPAGGGRMVSGEIQAPDMPQRSFPKEGVRWVWVSRV
jgi:hypothetical protein